MVRSLDLILLVIQHFDIILGMDWLALSYAVIDYKNKKVLFQALNEEVFSF